MIYNLIIIGLGLIYLSLKEYLNSKKSDNHVKDGDSKIDIDKIINLLQSTQDKLLTLVDDIMDRKWAPSYYDLINGKQIKNGQIKLFEDQDKRIKEEEKERNYRNVPNFIHGEGATNQSVNNLDNLIQ